MGTFHPEMYFTEVFSCDSSASLVSNSGMLGAFTGVIVDSSPNLWRSFDRWRGWWKEEGDGHVEGGAYSLRCRCYICFVF